MAANTWTDFTVEFVGDHFDLAVNVIVEGEFDDSNNEETNGYQDAIEAANDVMKYFYGWNVKPVSSIEINVKKAGSFI